MQKWIVLAVGGVVGTIARYALAGAVYRWAGTGFPYGTLAVNALGCAVIGFLGTLADEKFLLTPDARLFWMVGLLGAFTTFSTLIYESWRLLQDGEPELDEMIRDGLVTLEKAEVLMYRASQGQAVA